MTDGRANLKCPLGSHLVTDQSREHINIMCNRGSLSFEWEAVTDTTLLPGCQYG